MTIIEAIKSEKRFRLPGWHLWYINEIGHVNKFSNADLLRDDWEIEEEKIEITSEDFNRAYYKMQKKWDLTLKDKSSPYDAFIILSRELGFKK